MLIRQTPKNKEQYKKIRNTQTIYELELLDIHPKYADSNYCYFLITDELLDYFKRKELEQWLS